MNKQSLMSELSAKIKEWEVSKKELLDLYNKNSKSRINFSEIFGYLGGFILFLWISFLVGLYWNILNDYMKVLVTLWSWIVLFVSANLLLKWIQKKYVWLSLHLPPVFLIPMWIILFVEYFLDTSLLSEKLFFAILFGLLAFAYLINNYFVKSNLFVSLILIFWSLSYALWVSFLVDFFPVSNIWAYFLMFLGVFYVVISYLLKHYSVVSIIFNWSWALIFLYAFFMMLEQGVFWEFLFPFILGLYFYLSVRYSIKSFMFSWILFLIFYIFYLNFQYFSDILTWPMLLIVMGVGTISVSYYLSNKY